MHYSRAIYIFQIIVVWSFSSFLPTQALSNFILLPNVSWCEICSSRKIKIASVMCENQHLVHLIDFFQHPLDTNKRNNKAEA